MNVLLMSVGTRNKIVQYFKNTLSERGKVIAADMSNLAPALYEADRHYQVPGFMSENYLEIILDICKKEEINAVLTLIDPELSFLAANEKKFAEAGVKVIGSSLELCEMALDKMQMYTWLKAHGYNCAKSYKEKEDFYKDLDNGKITYPVFVKPIRGSASVAVTRAENKETVEFLYRHTEGLMIQEYMGGQEIGADCYIDMVSGEAVSIFTKRKLLMRAGETDKAVSFKDAKLFRLIEKFVFEAGYKGPIDIDIFENKGEYYISEINPRFGGGYPHAHECGCNHMELIENNVNGMANIRTVGSYCDGNYMMKYSEVYVR